MLLRVFLLTFILLIVHITADGASAYYFDHFDIANGLSQNTVTCIHQDRRGFMWFGTKNGLNRYDGYVFQTYSRNDGFSGLGNSIIYCMAESGNDIWVGTDKGVWILNNTTGRFRFLDCRLPNGAILDYTINKIAFYSTEVWILTANGIYILERGNKKLIALETRLKHSLPVSVTYRFTPVDLYSDGDRMWITVPFLGILEYAKGQFSLHRLGEKVRATSILRKNNLLFVGTLSDGLAVINVKKGTTVFHSLKAIDTHENSLIRVIANIDGNVWVGTEDGIFVYDMAKEKITDHISTENADPYSLANNAVYSIFQDSSGGIWVGTYFGGINLIPKNGIVFEKYYQIPEAGSIQGQRIREIVAEPSGNLWIATEDNGLNYFDAENRKFRHYSMSTSGIHLSYSNIQCLNLAGDELWIGYFTKGIDRLNIKTGKVRHYETLNCPTLDNNDIFSIYTDLSNTTWIGTSTGVLKYNTQTDCFEPCPDIGVFFISDICQDPGGYIWFATYNVGAIRYNPRNKTSKVFNYNPDDSTSICYNRITTIFEDSKQRLWFGSEDGGFCLYDAKTESFKSIRVADGLLSNVVHKILEDRYGRIWVSTNNGLSCYDPETGDIVNYNSQNGLLSCQFNYNSGVSVADGKLYFGNIKGLVGFYPKKELRENRKLKVTLTDFHLLNRAVDLEYIERKNHKNIACVDTVELSYDMSSFNISFSTLDYSSIATNRYAYMLEGEDKDWVYTSGRSATYNNLSPGEYLFRVKADNSDGSWDNPETNLRIIIIPPWYMSTVAKWVYTLVLIAGAYFSVRMYVNRVHRKYKLMEQEQEQKRKAEIYSAKIEFFTNIAHEIRTPLTLIKVPLESILEKELDSAKVSEYLQIIKRNTERLFFLINQLLDFRKIESKIMRLNREQVNLNSLIGDVLARFRLSMEQKGLIVTLLLPEKAIEVSVDKEAMTKILSNLFSNVIKYGKDYVKISLSQSANNESFEIKVVNGGKSIPVSLKEKVFEAFFRIGEEKSTTGSGLGLALAKSLVELHGGNIHVDSESECTAFIVQIPIINSEVQKSEIYSVASEVTDRSNEALYGNAAPETEGAGKEEDNLDKDAILIAEDNEELLNFLEENLSKKWKAYAVSNGGEALEVLDREKISLVISDVVMPVCSGMELLHKISTGKDTADIPVILLTAKTDSNSKIEALRNGVAAYLEKPFSMVQLEEQISNLIERHHKLRQKMKKTAIMDSASSAKNKNEERFLNKVTDIILANIEKENFNVDELADELCMSRTSLHRKLKSISGETPGDFIRMIRLKRAAELLVNGEFRISEICLLVGFHSSSYFTKSFYKQYGVLPKDYVKSMENKDR